MFTSHSARRAASVLAYLLCVAATNGFAADRPQLITVKLRFYEGDPLNIKANTSKVIAEPVIVAKNGDATTFVSGGELALESERGVDLSFGLLCEVKPTLLAEDRVLVEVRAEQTSPTRENDRQVTIAGSVARSVAVVKPGEAILLGPLERGKDKKSLWIEARAEVYEPNQPSPRPEPIVVRAETAPRSTRSSWTTVREAMLKPLGLAK